MIETLSRADTQAAIRSVLAADCACPVPAFVEDEPRVTPAEERPVRRLYPIPTKPLSVVTMGRGVVISCYPAWAASLRALLGKRDRDEIFAAPTIAELSRFVALDGGVFLGPALSFACSPETFRPAADPEGVSISVVEGEVVRDLYQYPGFSYALSYQPDHPRPDVAAAVARRNGEIVGIAGMSADCETLWQIGIEVVAGFRGAGIGRSLVSRLTDHAFQRNRVPFYTADLGNLRSQAIPPTLGYWPAWVELFTRDVACATASTTS